MSPSFADAAVAWSSPPLDEIGYLPAQDLLKLPDQELLDLIRRAEESRYLGWRNYENRWRDVLGLDSTHDKHVLDYGCGAGIEALQYARLHNSVVVADISRVNVLLALRVLRLEGYEASSFQITPEHLVHGFFGEFDVIHCAGVLHHIPEPRPVVEAMAGQLADCGELRLMLYSDEAWRIACGTDPPEVVADDPQFSKYWQHWDPIGGYADWYNYERLEERFGDLFFIKRYKQLTKNGAYIGAVLEKK